MEIKRDVLFSAQLNTTACAFDFTIKIQKLF